jgi:hypothetical protein
VIVCGCVISIFTHGAKERKDEVMVGDEALSLSVSGLDTHTHTHTHPEEEKPKPLVVITAKA